MPEWDASQYLRYERERARPCIDLIGRLSASAPRRIVDLGCGTGVSTRLLRARWPSSELLGVDRSASMLAAARGSDRTVRWLEGDLRTWTPDGPMELVFSNAALQWVPDHDRQIPRLWGWVAPGGTFAFQLPVRGDPPPPWIAALADVQRRPPWRDRPPPPDPAENVLPLARYYELLAAEAAEVELWDTEYHHVLAAPADIVEWGRGTGLRPWLERLGGEEERAAFLREYEAEVARRYPLRADGRVLHPFRRRFVVAHRAR